ncbi:MAG TPA: hypothetical protein EYG80_00505 [Flavobacteriaceae bacterium]|nr:hypothetical protein [Flavobacteriaceae bacterium]
MIRIKFVFLLIGIVLMNGCSTKFSTSKSSASSSEAHYKSTNIDGNSKLLTYLGSAILFGVIYSVALKKSYEDQ